MTASRSSTTGWGTFARSRRRWSGLGRRPRSPPIATRVESADGVILPGVGAFPKAMEPGPRDGARRAGRRAASRPGSRFSASASACSCSSSPPIENEGAGGLGLLAGIVAPLEAKAARSRTSAGRRSAGSTPRGSPRASARRRPSTSCTRSRRARHAGDDVLGTRRLWRALRLRCRARHRSTASSSTRRSRAPRGCGLLANFARDLRAVPRVILYPGDRHPRRPGRAADAGRLRPRDRLRRRPASTLRGAGWTGAPAGCTSSTSTAPGRASR